MSLVATIVVIAAILLPAILYIAIAARERHRVTSIYEFFPLTRFLDAESYGRSTAAAGVSLATVILTLVNLAPVLGISLSVTISSYALSFVLLYFCAPRILQANPNNDTLQAYIGNSYGSSHVRNVALFFSFVGYVSIFSMELLVGVTVLKPFFQDYVLLFSTVYLVFIIVYSLISGFRAIVATEQWQIRFIAASVIVLFLLLPILWPVYFTSVSFIEVSANVFSSWEAPWSFCLGIIVMNLPAPISDSGTWQRLCATKSAADARRGLVRAICLFLLIWGALILISCYLSQAASLSGAFDSKSSTLMTFIITSLASGGLLTLALLFVFVLGLFAAMITTADSLLLVAAQMLSIDFFNFHNQSEKNSQGLAKARIALALIAVASFAIFLFFHMIAFDVIALIFAIYGAQLALFPAVAASLFLKRRLNCLKAGPAATISICGGFIAAWTSAFYGKWSGKSDWIYNAPAIALLISLLLFFTFSTKAWELADADVADDVQ